MTTETTITEVRPKAELRLCQTSKSFWYVERIGLVGDDMTELITDMERHAINVIKTLEALNKK